jgi:hypothetical protein
VPGAGRGAARGAVPRSRRRRAAGSRVPRRRVFGPGQGDLHGGGADVPGGEQPASRALVLEPQAEVGPALGRRLDHGEGTEGRGQADECLAGLHRYRAE